MEVFNCEYNGEAFGASMRASEGAEKVAPVHMQHPAGMPGMLHPDGMSNLTYSGTAAAQAARKCIALALSKRVLATLNST